MDDLIDRGGGTGSNGTGMLPYSGAVLALGIISIATCWLYGIPGIVCGIIAIVLHKKNTAVYNTDPSNYEQAYKNSKAGNICAIIGLSLSALYLIIVVFVVTMALNNGFR